VHARFAINNITILNVVIANNNSFAVRTDYLVTFSRTEHRTNNFPTRPTCREPSTTISTNGTHSFLGVFFLGGIFSRGNFFSGEFSKRERERERERERKKGEFSIPFISNSGKGGEKKWSSKKKKKNYD
jgi:hypothetical protein